MNGDAHINIIKAAATVLPEPLRAQFTKNYELLCKVSNYPDYFDDPSRPEADKLKTDPEWYRFCIYPEYLPARTMHSWPGHTSNQTERIPLLEYLLEQMISCRNDNDTSGFIKFSGCLSHYFGDIIQPAHLTPASDPDYIGKLLPAPDTPEFANFHYHTSIESVTGICGKLHSLELLGTSSSEAAWRLSRRCLDAIRHCHRFIVPIVQALFEKNQEAATAAASEPVTIAAQLTADAIFTVNAIAENVFSEDALNALKSVDLRLVIPDTQFHDLVYSGAILDGNKAVPPNDAPIIPAKLRFGDKERIVKGLGMLPHSGMSGPRECRMLWKLPAGVFKIFSAIVGMHCDLAAGGAASFHVLVNGTEIWSSGKMTSVDQARPVNLKLDNAHEICLIVRDANNGTSFWKNHAFWATPLLTK